MALGTRALAAIGAAVAASALIALLLLRGGAGEGGAVGPTTGSARRAPEAPAAAAPMTRADAAAFAAEDPSPPDPPPAAEGPSVEVRVILGGVQPIPGCLVMVVGKDADQEYSARFGDDEPVRGETDANGRCVLRWPSEPKERLVAVFLDHGSKVERVEGAAQVGELGEGRPVLLAGALPVTVHLDDGGGPPRIRILDDATGRAVDPGAEPVIEWDLPAEVAPRAMRVPLRHESAGWWALGPIWQGATAARVRAAGYLDHPLEDWGRTGRHTVRLAASPTGVAGVLKIPPKIERRPPLLDARLVRVDEGDRGPRPPLGRVGGGAFRLDGLVPGEWCLEVHWHAVPPATVALWTTKRFAYGGERIDLGTLDAKPGSTLRVRWASASALPEGAVLVLADSRHIRPKGSDDRGWGVSDGPIDPYPAARGRGQPADGIFVFDGLLPGGEYELSCPRIPGWKETVRAPEEPGGERTHEAGREFRIVKCRITFTVDGQVPAVPLAMDQLNGVGEFDPDTRRLTAHFVPGTHWLVITLVDVEAEKERRDFIRSGRTSGTVLFAEVQVPNEAEYEATVDLKTK